MAFECRLRGNGCGTDVFTAGTGAQSACLTDKKRESPIKWLISSYLRSARDSGQALGWTQARSLSLENLEQPSLLALAAILLVSLTKVGFLKPHNDYGQSVGERDSIKGPGLRRRGWGRACSGVLYAHCGPSKLIQV